MTGPEVGVGFAPADPPRSGTVVYWGGTLPDAGEPGTAAVVPSPGTAVVELPVRNVGLDAALPLLLAGGGTPFWAARARTPLRSATRRPGSSTRIRSC